MIEKDITHVLSVIKYSFDGWGEEAKRFKHMSIDIDDMDDQDILGHLSSAVRFIESGLYPSSAHASASEASPGAVYVHCAMGKSRSVSCVVAWLLYKYPHRFGGKEFAPSSASAVQRRETASSAVGQAVEWVRQGRPIAEPNSGFMRQLELWWEMGCPADDDRAVENHPIYQKWLYECKLKESRDLGMAPEAEWIRFEDEEEGTVKEDNAGLQAGTAAGAANEIRCKKCRQVLANSKFVVEHQGTGNKASSAANCAHIFIETLSWMRPALEEGALDGRLVCQNAKCGATIGRFAWQGFKCTCGEWICPAFSLNRSRVDEVVVRSAAGHGIRMPPGRNGSL